MARDVAGVLQHVMEHRALTAQDARIKMVGHCCQHVSMLHVDSKVAVGAGVKVAAGVKTDQRVQQFEHRPDQLRTVGVQTRQVAQVGNGVHRLAVRGHGGSRRCEQRRQI